MNAGQCEHLHKSLTRLRLCKSRERLEELLQAALRRAFVCRFSRPALGRRSGLQDAEEYRHADKLGALPVCEKLGAFRVLLSALI